MSSAEQLWRPPTPLGEPFRAQPEGDIPFERENPREERQRLVQSAWVGPTGPQFVQSTPVAVPVASHNPAERRARWAFWIGVASVFVFNVILGPIAMVLGLQSIRRGERRLGQLALLFGTIGTVIGMVVLLLVAQGIMPSTEELLRRLREGS